jgi:PAS domain S-box-containing protein
MSDEQDWQERCFNGFTTAALRKSKGHYCVVFEASPFPMAIVEMPSQRFIRVNRRFVELTGYEEDELLALTVPDITHPDDREAEQSTVRDRTEGRLDEFVFEKRYVRKDGGTRTVVVYGEPAVGVDGEPLAIGIVLDVTERRASEEALRRSERTARALIEATSEAAALMTVDGIILTANRHFSTALGWPDADDIVGKCGWDLVPPELARGRKEKVAEVVRSRRPVMFEDVHSGRVLLNSIYPVVDDNGIVRTIAVFGRDVTEERRTELALKEREEKYRSLFDQSREAIAIVSPDGAVLDANQAWLNLCGYRKSDLMGLNVADTYVDPAERQDFLSRMKHGGIVRDEVWLRKRDGSAMLCERSVTQWKDSDGITVAFQAFMRDVTAQRMTEQALKQSEAKYRSLFEQSREAIAIVAPDGVILEANQTWLDLFGYAREELPGLNIVATYCDPRDRESFLRRMACDDFVKDEVWFRRRDGTPVLCERTTTAWRADGGEVVAFQAFVRDITGQRQMEHDLQAQAAQLRMLAQRVEAAREEERMGIARELHDRIGQELTAVKLDLTGIQNRLTRGQEPDLREFVELDRLVDLAARDVRQISSELRPGVLDDVGLAGAIEWHVGELRRRSSIAFHLNLAENIALDDARRTALFRVFQELATNVVRHARASSVRVSLEQEPAGPVVLVASDDGQGMDLRKVEDAASLGIVGMRERLQPFGGTLSYESRPGGGTVARVVMPAG